MYSGRENGGQNFGRWPTPPRSMDAKMSPLTAFVVVWLVMLVSTVIISCGITLGYHIAVAILGSLIGA